MTTFNIATNKKDNGFGETFTNTNDLSAFVVSLEGHTTGAYIDLVYSPNGSHMVVAGTISEAEPARLVVLPSGGELNIQVHGASSLTDITVTVAYQWISP